MMLLDDEKEDKYYKYKWVEVYNVLEVKDGVSEGNFVIDVYLYLIIFVEIVMRNDFYVVSNCLILDKILWVEIF